MKIMTVAAMFVLSTGLAWGATEKKPPSPAQQAQQAKMKSCNADAAKKALKGEERKKFMSGCLKGGSQP